MTEQPPPRRRPNPVERGLESLLFNSRWLMAPFYVGLVISLAVLLFKFALLLFECRHHRHHAFDKARACLTLRTKADFAPLYTRTE